MDNRSFLGTGMSFPPVIDPGTGRVSVSVGARNVKESVYIILMTTVGERWLEPDFGSSLTRFAFMDISITTINIMSDSIRGTILSQEPRISDVAIEIDPESKENCLIVRVNYTLAADSSVDNLVFPFYLNAVREEAEDAES